MSSAYLDDDRLVDLLVRRATEQVGLAEVQEIERLLARYPEADREAIERTAAAVMLAGSIDAEPLPAGLRERLTENARRFTNSIAAGPSAAALSPSAPAVSKAPRRASKLPWLAAAACLLLAIGAWWPRLSQTPPEQQAQVPPATAPQAPLTAAQQRERMIASGATIMNLPWSNTEDPASGGVTGDVVWDNTTQSGYMRFRGLAANDPRLTQYQLWIFDAQQDQRYPIDGGVFDIPESPGDVIVPIKAAIKVREPAMFAVTIEKPGGVVVSGREHIVTLAKAAS